MEKLVRHCQPKGAETDRPNLNDSSCPLLYPSFTSGTHHEKAYVYVNGHMAAVKRRDESKEKIGTTHPDIITSSYQYTPALGEPSFEYESHYTHADVTFPVLGLNDDVLSFTVEVDRVQPSADNTNGGGNSDTNKHQEITLDQPEGGWGFNATQVVFERLQTGWEYSLKFKVHTLERSLPILGGDTVDVSYGSVIVPVSEDARHAWVVHRWVDGDEASGVSRGLHLKWKNAGPEDKTYTVWAVADDGQKYALSDGDVGASGELDVTQERLSLTCQLLPAGSTISSFSVYPDDGSGDGIGIISPVPPDTSCKFGFKFLWTTSYEYYGVDHLGTVRAVVQVDASGAETGRSLSTYEPFGLEIPPIDTCDNTHRFTGHERDPETDNDYMHFRYFGSTMGRFCKPDNIKGTMANPQSWNRYSYVIGNPVNFNDPTGHVGASPEDSIPLNPKSNLGVESQGRPDPGSDYYEVTETLTLDGEVVSQSTHYAMGGPKSSQAGSSPTAPADPRDLYVDALDNPVVQYYMLLSAQATGLDLKGRKGKDRLEWAFVLIYDTETGAYRVAINSTNDDSHTTFSAGYLDSSEIIYAAWHTHPYKGVVAGYYFDPNPNKSPSDPDVYGTFAETEFRCRLYVVGPVNIWHYNPVESRFDPVRKTEEYLGVKIYKRP